MKLSDIDKARICIAMRECQPMEMQVGNTMILVDEGNGPWGQATICGAVVHGHGFEARQWCRSLDELMEFLEVFA